MYKSVNRADSIPYNQNQRAHQLWHVGSLQVPTQHPGLHCPGGLSPSIQRPGLHLLVDLIQAVLLPNQSHASYVRRSDIKVQWGNNSQPSHVLQRPVARATCFSEFVRENGLIWLACQSWNSWPLLGFHGFSWWSTLDIADHSSAWPEVLTSQ